jgi:peptide/nickel transport system substrate-binding protein
MRGEGEMPAMIGPSLPRREFLRVVLAGAGCGLMAACAPAAAPSGKGADAPGATGAATQPSAATPEERATAGGERANTFVFAYTASDPTTMDPAIANESQANVIVLAAYESLVAYRPGTIEIEPRLATEWKVSEDGRTYTFKLRPGVQFSDGAQFDAEAVKFSFDRLHGMGKGPAFVLEGIYDRVDVVDPLTVNVVLKTPVGHFLSMLPKVFIVNPRFVKEHATAEDQWAEKYLYDHVNGTGPFDVERWDHNSQVVFARKVNYWGLPDRPKIERAVLRVISDLSTARLLLEKGDLDLWGTGIPLDAVGQLKSNQNLVVAEDETIVSLYVQVSQVRPPFDDPRVRKAVALSFDYTGFIEGIYQGHAVPLQGPMPRRIPFHDSTLPVLQKDIAEAKRLLAEAGYPDGGLELEYVAVQGDPPERGAGLILQEGLKELGINLKIVEQTWPTMVGRMQTTDRAQLMQLYGYYRFPPYADPDAYFFGPWHTTQQIKGYNGTFYGNAETDRLMDQGRTTTEPAERERIYKQLQRRLVDDTAALFLANPTAIIAHRSWVKAYKYTPAWNQTLNLDEIALEGKR